MRMFRKLALGLLFIVAASITGATTAMAQSRIYGSSDSFYNDLAPYGRWVNNREYGTIWIPDVERDFKPYATRGHWAMTEYGNTWVSEYEWGWAAFHYGRWTYDDYYGSWIWIPGNEWAPAWVSWRYDNDYYGWAPLGPGLDININIHIPLERWIFVPKRYIIQRNVYDYCLPRQRVVYVYRNTAVISNVYVHGSRRYVCGPYRDDIERYTRQRVNVYRIENNGRPGRMEERDGSLRVYRPETSSREYRNYRDENRLGDSRSNAPNNREEMDGSARYDHPGREYPGNSGRGAERTNDYGTSRGGEDRYNRQQRAESSGTIPNRASEASASENRQPRSERSGERGQRPDIYRGNSPSSPSGQRTPSSSAGRGSNDGGSSGNNQGRGRPIRG